jgi:hypothetical protein
MNTLKILILIVLVLILNNYDRKHEPAPIKPESGLSVPEPESTIGVYDSSFDKAKWTSIINSDGRKLLKHNIVADCYVGYNSDL